MYHQTSLDKITKIKVTHMLVTMYPAKIIANTVQKKKKRKKRNSKISPDTQRIKQYQHPKSNKIRQRPRCLFDGWKNDRRMSIETRSYRYTIEQHERRLKEVGKKALCMSYRGGSVSRRKNLVVVSPGVVIMPALTFLAFAFAYPREATAPLTSPVFA